MPKGQITKRSIIPREQWGIYAGDKIKNIVDELELSISESNITGISAVFSDDKAMQSLIVARGNKGEYYDLIIKAFEIFCRETKTGLTKKAFGSLLTALTEKGAGHDCLSRLLSAYFHKRSKAKFVRLSGLIISNKDKLESDVLYARTLHDTATWTYETENDHESAIELNRKAIRESDGEGIGFLQAKYGLIHYKVLMPKQKVRDYTELAKDFLVQSDVYDSFRAHVEAAQALEDLARMQGTKDEAFNNLKRAKNEALLSLKISREINYPNLEIISSEILADIYHVRNGLYLKVKHRSDAKEGRKFDRIRNKYRKICRDDARKSQSYAKRSAALRKKYGYKTRFRRRYGDLFFKHSGVVEKQP